jgi:hypothetical protein
MKIYTTVKPRKLGFSTDCSEEIKALEEAFEKYQKENGFNSMARGETPVLITGLNHPLGDTIITQMNWPSPKNLFF